MARNVLVDTGFLVAWLAERDFHHPWAFRQARNFPPPWLTCEASLSEAFYLLGSLGGSSLATLLLRRAVLVVFNLADNLETVLRLMEKYANVPMSLADACLVRMTETLAEPLILTTDQDFRLYRRLGRQIIPCATPE
jgi:uncharacterized protein